VNDILFVVEKAQLWDVDPKGTLLPATWRSIGIFPWEGSVGKLLLSSSTEKINVGVESSRCLLDLLEATPISVTAPKMRLFGIWKITPLSHNFGNRTKRTAFSTYDIMKFSAIALALLSTLAVSESAASLRGPSKAAGQAKPTLPNGISCRMCPDDDDYVWPIPNRKGNPWFWIPDLRRFFGLTLFRLDMHCWLEAV
jgi:hypothetical protein